MSNTEELLNKLSPEERKIALGILNDVGTTGSSKKLDELKYADWKEIPVDIETFLTDDKYLGKAWKDTNGKSKLYPFWLEQLKKLFPNNTDTAYNTFLESGARGIGKSEVTYGAVCPYLMYRTLCLKNPHEYYDIKLNEKIVFAFMNIKKDLTEAIAVDKFQKTVQMSPWFMARGSMTQRNNKPYWNPPSIIEIVIGSQSDDVIGLPIYFAAFDEISFLKNKDVNEQKKKALDMIDTALGGMRTRFIRNGKNPTVLAVASSKRSEQSFMESYIRQLSETQDASTLIVDKPVWEVKPKGTFSEKTFFIGIGNKFKANIIIPDSDKDKLQEYRDKGYRIIESPIDFKAKALEGLDRMLCDYAGESTFSSNKFLDSSRVIDVVSDAIQNPMPDIITVGNGKDDDTEYKDFFDMNKVPKEMFGKPMFIHLDMSVTGDKTGIAGTCIVGKKPTSDGNPGKDLFYQLVFSTSVQAPKGRQISFEKNRNFIRWLREQGFQIQQITSDTFQSVDLLQILQSEGFNTSVLSVDRVETVAGEQAGICRPYQYLKSTIYEGRIRIYRTELLQEELIQLEKNNNNGKVDHPDKFSKDAADALCLGENTKVFLLSGKSKTIKELYSDKKNTVSNEWVLSYDTVTHKLVPNKIQDILCNGSRQDLIEITFDTGESIVCTPDHKLLCRDGTYIEAKDSMNISLMPFVIEKKNMYGDRDYYYVYNPESDLTSTGLYLHKLVCSNSHEDEYNTKKKNLRESEWIVIHHIDCNRYNNNPDNLVYLTNVEHSIIHTDMNTSEKKRNQLKEFNKRLILEGNHPFQNLSEDTRKYLKELAKKNIIEYNKSQKHKDKAKEVNKRLTKEGKHPFQLYKYKTHTDEANRKRKNTCLERYGGENPCCSAEVQKKMRETCLRNNGYDNPWHSPQKQHEILINKIKNTYNKVINAYSLNPKESMKLMDFKLACYKLQLCCSQKVEHIKESGINVDCTNFNSREYEKLRTLGSIVKNFLKTMSTNKFTLQEFENYHKAKLLSDKTYRRRYNNLKYSYNDILRLGFNIYNHRVVKITKITKEQCVYDIKLDKIHNFALQSGIFVHNCGSVFTASQHAEEFAHDYGETADSIFEINKDSEESTQKQLVVDFERELEKMNSFTERQREQMRKEEEGKSIAVSTDIIF